MMKKATRKSGTESSGNIFTDLGFQDSRVVGLVRGGGAEAGPTNATVG
jgi:hypothetical protein